MPTAAERKAMIFLAAIAVVGGGVRLADGRRFERDVNRATGDTVRADSGSPSDQALSAQLAAVDSARATGPHRKGGRSSRTRRTRVQADAYDGAYSGAMPPGAPDRRQRSSDASTRSTPKPGKLSPTTDEPLDVNAASAAELERLPKVGPVLAQRIVAWRDTHGKFDSMEALRHVPGIGAVTASLVAPLVTFSNGYRPSGK
jgi:competence protein ComEA